MQYNPYDVTSTSGLYVGNEDLRSDIQARIALGRQAFAIIGGRRCGKTFTLHQLRKDLDKGNRGGRRYLSAYVSPGAIEEGKESTRGFFDALLGDIRAQIAPASCGDVEEHAPLRSFCKRIGEISETLRSRYGEWVIVLMIDEIDAIVRRVPAAGGLLANLRELVSSSDLRSKLRLIVTGVNDLSGVMEVGSPLRNILAKKELGVIDEGAMDRLIRYGFGESLDEEAIGSLKELTGGHPYLLQGLLHELWLEWGERSSRLGADAVGRARSAFEGQYGENFEVWKRAIGELGRGVYGSLSAIGGHASIEDLRGCLRYTGGDIDKGVAWLACHGLIEQIEGEEVQICGSMFREWFEQQVAVPAIVETLAEVRKLVESSRIDASVREAVVAQLDKAREGLGAEDGDREGVRSFFRNCMQLLRGVGQSAGAVEKVIRLLEKAFPFLGISNGASGL